MIILPAAAPVAATTTTPPPFFLRTLLPGFLWLPAIIVTVIIAIAFITRIGGCIKLLAQFAPFRETWVGAPRIAVSFLCVVPAFAK